MNNGNNAIDGTYTPFNEMLSQVRGGAANDAAYQKIQGNNPDGSPNAGFPAYIDMPNYIDYMLCNFYLGTDDWAGNASQGTRNYYCGRWRAPETKGYQWFVWDAERSLQYLVPTNVTFGPAEPFVWLRNNAEFRMLFADHVQRHFFNEGALVADTRIARYTELAETIRPSIKLAEARWDRTTRDTFETDVADRTANWFPDRVTTVIDHFRSQNLFPSIDAPEYSHHGGSVSPTTQVTMATVADSIYYTLDGSDPRLPGGTVSPSAVAATFSGGGPQPFEFITTGYVWKYLDDGSDQGTAWQSPSFEDDSWESGPSQLGYGDPSATTVSFGSDPSNKYPTTYFRTTVDIPDLSIWSHFTMRLKYDDGIAVYLNGQEIERANLDDNAAFDDFAPSSVSSENSFKDFVIDTEKFVAGINTFAVEIHQRSGTNSDIRLDMVLRGEVTSNGAPNISDPLFFSQPTTLNSRAFNSATSEWSALNTAVFSIDTVPADASNLVISEIHYRPAEPTAAGEIAVSSDRDDYEFIELFNIGAQTVDLSGVSLSDGVDYSFADQTTLASGSHIVLVSNMVAFTARYGALAPGTLVGEYSGSFNNDGERVALTRQAIGDFREVTYNDQLPWPEEPDGNGPSLTLLAPNSNPDHTDSASWTASATIGGTPGLPE